MDGWAIVLREVQAGVRFNLMWETVSGWVLVYIATK